VFAAHAEGDEEHMFAAKMEAAPCPLEDLLTADLLWEVRHTVNSLLLHLCFPTFCHHFSFYPSFIWLVGTLYSVGSFETAVIP
jgi:hypothetical protein